MCQKGVKEPLDLKMEVTFKNKHGYLECGYFGFINFEFILGTMYVLVLFYWLMKISKWQESVMFFHKLLTAICIISMLDEFMKLYSLNYENKFVTNLITILCFFRKWLPVSLANHSQRKKSNTFMIYNYLRMFMIR